MDRPERLIRAFQAFDGDHSGRVNTEAMAIILTTIGKPLTAQEMSELVSDADENGFIDYRRFVNSVVFASD